MTRSDDTYRFGIWSTESILSVSSRHNDQRSTEQSAQPYGVSTQYRKVCIISDSLYYVNGLSPLKT